MKVTKPCLCIIFLVILSSRLSAANRYWVGVLNGNWSTSLNWSASSGGLGGASVPGSSDVAIFDGGFLSLSQGQCTMDIAVTVSAITVTGGYGGTIVQASALTVSGAASFGGGIFSGGSSNILIGGIFTNSGTDFTSTSGTMELRGDVAFTGGSFSHNSGWVKFNDAAAENITGTSPVFYDLEFVGRGNSYTLGSAGSIGVVNSLNISGAANCVLNTGTLDVSGANIILTNTATGDGGTATINISGGASQNIISTLSINQGTLPSVSINKSGGTLLLPALITVMGNWTYVTGTIDATTNNSTVVFNNTLTITGSHSLNNLIFEGTNNWTITIAAGTTLSLNGNMSITGSNNIVLNTGTINLNGDLILTNTATGGGGTAVIDFIGTTNQAISSALAINQSSLPAITINKTTGTLSFPALITVCGNWTYLAGTMDVVTNNSTVVFAKTLGISGIAHTLNNVLFEGNNNWTFTINTGALMIVAGTLTTTGASNIFINATVAGTTVMQAQGDVLINNSSATGGGQGQILMNGTGAQALTSTAAAGRGLLPYIRIQKPSGTVSLSGVISESRDWTYVSGTVVPGTSNVVFGGNSLSVTSAGMNFYDVAVATNTITLVNSMTVNNNLSVRGTAILAAGTSTINLGGNWTNWGTGGFSEGTGTVNLNGSGTQIVTTTGGENFANLSVNNSGSGVQMMNAVAVATGLTMVQGNINLNGNGLVLGSSVLSKGLLTFTSGNMFGGGSFTRWFNTAVIADGSVTGLFPMGTAVDPRPFYVSAPVTAATTGGTIRVSYTDAATNTLAPTFADGASTIQVRKDLNWAVSAGNGLAGGVYNLDIRGTNFGLIGNVSDLRLTRANTVIGTPGVNAGTIANPQVNRTGVTFANLANTYYIGSVDMVSTPLPVTLISFTANVVGSSVDVRWRTAAEINNNYFEVQRSIEEAAWETIGKANGIGNSSLDREYTLRDNSPGHGVLYYRLVQVDLDGRKTMSAVVSVRLGNNKTGGEEFGIQVFPNPAVNYINVALSGGGKWEAMLISRAGQIIKTQIAGGGNRIMMDVSGVQPGVYFIKVMQEGKMETKEIVVER